MLLKFYRMVRSHGQVLQTDKTLSDKRCSESIGDFSAKMYSLLSKSDENIFFSPLSIAACLQMVHHGAKGNTKKQISDVMGILGIADEDILSFYYHLIKTLNRSEDDFTALSVANRVWIKDNYKVLEDYKELLQEKLHADIISNPFTDPSLVAEEVNGWVSDSTNAMITKLVDPSMITDLTRLILCNAIYFKGLWDRPFDTCNEADFHVSAKKTQKVQMMQYYRNLELMYGENSVARYVLLPYKGNKDINMMIILPQVPYQLCQVEEQIVKAGVIDEWYKSVTSRDVNLKLPKFKFEEEYDLKELLVQMGAEDMFMPGIADFSGVNGEFLYAVYNLHVIKLCDVLTTCI